MQSRLLGLFITCIENTESLKKLRIIKQNLIHIHGLPKNLVDIEILKSNEYFGQYGTIKNVVLSKKINPETRKEIYSVYITYENKIEAACAILCVDSLLICGKIIRAFFGTTKYCNFFLENTTCKNLKKCLFLHQLVTNKDIIIGPNTNFSYNDHLNMSRKIIEHNKLQIKNIILKNAENSKILPTVDFIFLSEEQKEKYFEQNDISYIRSNDNRIIDTCTKFNYNIINIYNININNSNNNKFHNNDINKSDKNYNKLIFNSDNFDFKFKYKYNVNKAKNHDIIELSNLFKEPIKHILLSQPFFSGIKNISLKKIEFNFFNNNLLKKGVDINIVLDGCLDCLKDCI